MRCPSPKYVWPRNKVIAVPCGKCLACLSNKRQDWAVRLMQEYKVSSSGHFVTLTYSNKFLPNCGLVKKHVQLYIKRLRKHTPKLRYYAVGEYGSENGRPHYHLILFNANEQNIRRSWCTTDQKSGMVIPFGVVHVGKVTQASVAYTLKYIIQRGGEIDGQTPPFSLMSRAYGLGLNYLSDRMVQWHRDDARVYMVENGTKRRLPRYYKDKIWPNSDWSDWKDRREKVNQKALLEAEERYALETEQLKQQGYDPEKIRQESMQAWAAKVKQKVAYTQKF